jgi:hypothetical protein
MTLKDRYNVQKPWMQGGLIASTICALLFGFYLFVYFPIFAGVSRENQENNESDIILALPIITGHIVPFISHFILEDNAIASRVCTETKTECVHWSLAYEEGGVPWTNRDGTAGYCLQQETSPLSSCTERVQAVGTIGLIALLEMIYFIAGAGIATMLERRKKQ